MPEKDIQEEARTLVVKGAERWIDQWETDEGGGAAIVGWVLAVEGITLQGNTFTTFCSGNGDPTSGNGGGLAAHRFDGILLDVLRFVDVRQRMSYEAALEEED